MSNEDKTEVVKTPDITQHTETDKTSENVEIAETSENVEIAETSEIQNTEVKNVIPDSLNPVDPKELSDIESTEEDEEDNDKRRLSVVLEDPNGPKRTLKVLPERVEIPNPNDDIYEKAYAQFLDVIQGKEISAGKVILIVAIATQIVQNLKRNGVDPLGPKEKKAIVINMIKRWVDDAEDLDEVDKEFIKTVFIPCSLDGAIDSLCSLNVNKIVEKKTKKCLDMMCCGDSGISED
jgi:hypothetical protein